MTLAALAFLSLTMASPLRAQERAPVVGSCDGSAIEGDEGIAALAAAIALELEGRGTDAEVAVAIGCPGPSARVVVSHPSSGVRIERVVALAATAEHLRDRVIALVCGELVDAASALASGDPAEDTTDAPAPAPERGRPEESVETGAAPAPDRTSIADPAPAAVETAPAAPFEILIEAGARVFVSDAMGIFGHGEIGARWSWFRAAIRFAGTFIESAFADSQGYLASAAVGFGFDLREDRLDAGIEFLVEAGAAVTSARSRVDGYVGSTELHPLAGASARMRGGVRLSGALAFTAAIEIGGVYGVEVEAFDEPILSMHGFSAVAQVGLRVTP